MKATEQTLEQELARLIGEKLNVDYVTQSSISSYTAKLKGEHGRKQPDTIFNFPDCKIVLEVEVGKKNLLVGVAQAVNYQEVLGAEGSLVIAYPESIRREIETQEDVIDIVTNTKFSALVLTPFLRQNFTDIFLDELCNRIKKARSEPEPTDLNLVVNVLRDAVESLVLKLRRGKGIPKPALEQVVNQFELFSKLAGDDAKIDPLMIESIACDLVGYIMVNQILLYFLLSPTLGLPPFALIQNIPDLRTYFERITEIDYRAVYNIDVVHQLPRRCLIEINNIILAFRHLRPQEMKHDLLGRMFHEFIPFKTRKIFAAFYTKPVAAEILAKLAVNNFPERVIEPACGSGTLLVAAYQALRYEDPKMTHDQALRKIFALDIMPFATHLAALNLTLQDLSSQTEHVNVGISNSLALATDKHHNIARQDDLFGKILSRRVDVDQKHQEEITLPKEASVVIMNPPYTDRSRLTDQMLSTRIAVFKERQNYWAYFLSLANDLLAPNGIIAAVLPRLFLAGSTSKEVRKWLFNALGYELLFIIRTTKEFAFSESAAFRDFLFVLRKSDSLKHHNEPCKIVYLNRSLEDISIAEAGDIAHQIRFIRNTPEPIETADFTVFSISQEIIRNRSENLWFMVGFENPYNSVFISKIWIRLFELSGERLVRLKEAVGANTSKLVAKLIPRGFEPKPKGLYSAIFAVKELDKHRVTAKDLVINKENDKSIVCSFMGHTIEIPKTTLHLAIKTASYFRRFEISNEYGDLVLKERSKISLSIQKYSDVKINYSYINKSIEERESHLLVVKRIDITTPGTSFLAFCSKDKVVSPNTFYSIKCNVGCSQILCLWLNSVFGIIQFLDKRMETRGSYCDILKEDLIDFYVPTNLTLSPNLKKWYRKYSTIDFPPLSQQFVRDSPRRGLDRELMLLMGWNTSDVDNDLDLLYQALNDELQLLREAMKG